MSVHRKCINYFDEILKITGLDKIKKLRVCELGNLNTKSLTRDYFVSIGIPRFGEMKKYFEYLGYDDVSLDINGQDRALKVDLGKIINDKNLLNSFDIIFDAGTSEHVDNQYELFLNVFNLLKVGGVVIHILPLEGSYRYHGSWKYSLTYFEKFRKLLNYEVIDGRIIGNAYFYFAEKKLQVYIALRKTSDTNFVKKDKFIFPWYDEEGTKRDIKRYGDLVEEVRNEKPNTS